MPAFEEARRLGVGGIELDVRITADGIPVVIHDATVDRTTNARGRVARFTYAELRTLDAGRRGEEPGHGVRVPCLAEVLDWAATTGLVINTELKPAGSSSARIQLLRAMRKVIRENGRADHLVVSSFDPVLMAAIADEHLGVETAIVVRRPMRNAPAYAQRLGVHGIHPARLVAPRRLIVAARASGLAVRPWTVNDARHIAAFATAGCEAIVTDYPKRALAALQPQPFGDELRQVRSAEEELVERDRPRPGRQGAAADE